jgi:hypothetical protein
MKLTALLVPIIALAVGCAGGYVEAGGVSTTGAYVEAPLPGDADAFPRYWYDGEWVYDVHGAVYRHDGGHWYRFRERPVNLGRAYAPMRPSVRAPARIPRERIERAPQPRIEHRATERERR